MSYTAPKTILNHPAVETCDFGPDSGVEDYRHDVWLREGWTFKYGRNAGCRGCHFNTVADFLNAKPVQS
jgi:hypothetical protein